MATKIRPTKIATFCRVKIADRPDVAAEATADVTADATVAVGLLAVAALVTDGDNDGRLGSEAIEDTRLSNLLKVR